MRSKGEKRKITKTVDPAPVETVQKKLQRNTSELSETEAKEIVQTAERKNEHPEDEAAMRMNDEGSPHDVDSVGEEPVSEEPVIRETGASDLPEEKPDAEWGADIKHDKTKKRHPMRKAS